MKNYLITLITVSILLTSCRVTLLPNYDASVARQIDSTNKMIDRFYLNMAEINSAQRQYSNFVPDYVKIEVELISILNENKARTLNKDSEKISQNAFDEWEKYKDKHKADNTIKDADIKLNRIYMDEQLLRLRIGEKFKQTATH